MTVIRTKSPRETQKIAAMLADEAQKTELDHAMVIALQGDLGAGKTTFTQGFARALGIKENVLSPTFVIMKTYRIATGNMRPASAEATAGRQATRKRKFLVHIDCYRVDKPDDLVHLGLRAMLRDSDAIILIEWADRIREILPSDTVWLKFEHGKKSNERVITLES